jgi:hypothetical protein
MPAPKLVKTRIRLYDVDTTTGFKFLAFPAGMELPEAEYKRLARLNGAAHAVRPEPVGEEKPAATAAPELAALSRAQLMVEAKMRGLKVETRMTKAELVELCEKAAS